MSRFKGNWSFLGTISENPNSDSSQIHQVGVESRCESMQPITVLNHSSRVSASKRDRSQTSFPTHSRTMHNPYKKSKLSPRKGFLPLEERNVNSHSSSKNRQPRSQMKGTGDITRFLVKPDPRYARSFPSNATVSAKGSGNSGHSGASSSFRISAHSFASKKSLARSFFGPRFTRKQNVMSSNRCSETEPKRNHRIDTQIDDTAAFHTRVNESNSIIDDETEKITLEYSVKSPERHNFYDLSTLDSFDSGDLQQDPEDTNERKKPDTLTVNDAVLASTETNCNYNAQNVERTLFTDRLGAINEKEVTTSKFFSKKAASRRVTLDSFVHPSKASTISKSISGTIRRPRGLGEYKGDSKLKTKHLPRIKSIRMRTSGGLLSSMKQKACHTPRVGRITPLKKKGRSSNPSVKSFFSPRENSKDGNNNQLSC